jgi:hypothetical protein
MNASFRIAVAALLLLACPWAEAQQQHASSGGAHYKWRDGQGQLHYSDSLTTEALKYGYDVIDDRGIAVQHVQRQLTPAEQEAARAQAAQAAARQRAEDEQARADIQLMAAYPDEASYRAMQKMTLDSIDQQIDNAGTSLLSQEKALADLLARAADLERAKQPVPKSLADSIGRQRGVVAEQHATMDRLRASRSVAEQRARQQLEHYRSLKAAAAAAATSS